MSADKKPIEITDEAHFNAALAAAPGQVLVDFVMEGCGACEDDKPKVEALAAGCEGVTVLRVDGERLSKLADKYNVEAFPTMFHGKTAAAATPERAVEVEPEEMMKKLKCVRPAK